MNIKDQLNNPRLNLLIVEDDPSLASTLKLLAADNFRVFIAQKPSLIPDHIFFHAALVDMHLEVSPTETSDGIIVIQKIIKKNPQLEIVAMSGNIDRQLMEKAVQAGAQRFLAKPLSADEVKAVLEKIEAYWNMRLTSAQNSKLNAKLIGSSSSTDNLRKKIAELKSEKSPILIEGETGVGKDVVSRLLNQQEGNTPYISVNCSALSENLFESEFFGHIKGSFTGADSNKIGFAEAAHGGDLFLDEIEALPLSQQAKLLRFLESGEIRKVGSKDSQHVEVRIIAASNIPLKQLILEKKFREDLYFRLSAHRIEIPPLRDRKDDIPDIANSFLESSKPKRNKSFDNQALQELKKYNWPGNIRELKRVCEQLILTSQLPMIRDIDVQKILNIGSALPEISIQSSLNQSLDEQLRKQEQKIIEFCLSQTKDLDKCCDILKISKSSLYKKIKDLGITYE
ncbi:MAG: sigma-54 dependent transcriptional regulator [Bdellovibrionota bacterium]